MLDDFGESKVTVIKVDLLEVLRKNREAHRATYLKAAEGYRNAVELALESALKYIRDGQAIAPNLARMTSLTIPTEHTKDYDRVIRMLEMSTADEITVTETQFSQFVLDDWSWKQAFIGSTSRYSG